MVARHRREAVRLRSGSARQLNAEIRQVFRDQVYRIDHYLGKETVQNLAVFRFGNGLFEPIWNRRYIDSVQITVSETVGSRAAASSTTRPARCATSSRTTPAAAGHRSPWSRRFRA